METIYILAMFAVPLIFIGCFWIAIDQKEGQISFWKIIIIAVVASLLVFIPAVGALLAFIVPAVLLYQMSTREWYNSIFPCIVAVVLAKLFLLGVAFYLNQKIVEKQQDEYKKFEKMVIEK